MSIGIVIVTHYRLGEEFLQDMIYGMHVFMSGQQAKIFLFQIYTVKILEQLVQL